MEIFLEIFVISIAETAKRLMKIWKENNILEPRRVKKAIVPSDLGKIPTKIEIPFDGFTTDGCKNLTLIFPYML